MWGFLNTLCHIVITVWFSTCAKQVVSVLQVRLSVIRLCLDYIVKFPVGNSLWPHKNFHTKISTDCLYILFLLFLPWQFKASEGTKDMSKKKKFSFTLRTVYSVMTLEVWVSVFSFFLDEMSTWSSSSIPSCSSLSIKAFNRGSWRTNALFTICFAVLLFHHYYFHEANIYMVIFKAYPYSIIFKHPLNVLK